MPVHKKPFKAAIHAGEMQIGCWLGLAEPYLVEISGSAGFDWILIVAEHAPNNLRSVVTHLQILEGLPSHAVVRPPIGETWLVRQCLEAGAQTILVPTVESAEQARDLVNAITYPTHGTRGVGSALGRSSRITGIADCLTTAEHELCLLVQIESSAGIATLDDILKVEGVQGVFIGRSELAADLGHSGKPEIPKVRDAVLASVRKIVGAVKPAGILTTDKALQTDCADIAARFIATEIALTLFANGMRRAASDSVAHLSR